MIRTTLTQISSRMSIMLINQLSVLVTLPWLVAHLTPITFGLVAMALIVMQSGWVLIDWGQVNYVTEVWHQHGTPEKKSKLITGMICSRLLLAGTYLFLMAVLISVDIIRLPWIFFMAIAPATVSSALFPLWFYHVIKKPGELVWVTLVSRTIFVLLVAWWVRGTPTPQPT